MRLSKLFIVCLSVMIVSGVVGLLHPSESAEARKWKDKFITNKQLKDLILELNDQVGSLSSNTACAVPPTWGGVIPGDERFVPTFVDADGVAYAYCDLQTGLVWEAEPDNTELNWKDALKHCIDSAESWSGQKGGRLPSIPELASLVDTTSSNCPGVCLPDGNPFTTVLPKAYWSASKNVNETERAWNVDFHNGRLFSDPISETFKFYAWCVRGPMNTDGY